MNLRLLSKFAKIASQMALKILNKPESIFLFAYKLLLATN